MQTLHSDVIGSLLRPGYLKAARLAHERGELTPATFKQIEDRAVNEAIALQVSAGLEVITDGEMRRYAFYGHLIDCVDGFDKLGGWAIPFRDEQGNKLLLQRPVIVQRRELGGVEIAVRRDARQREEIAQRVRSHADRRVEGRRAERSIPHVEIAGRVRLIEPRLGDDVHHQTALVAVFGRRDARNDFHRLHRVRRQLIRIHAALLVGDRLIVDRELGLCVIADRMEKAVRISHDPGRRHGDDLVQSGQFDVGLRLGVHVWT